MTEQVETNPVAEEDVDTSEEAGVAQAQDGEGEAQDETGDNPEGTAEDDSEELEHDGQKFRLPKEVAAAIKPSLMMHADYTKKTQQLAEDRRAFESQRTSAGAEDAELDELRAKVMVGEQQIAGLDQQLAEYQKVSPAQWAAWRQQDPVAADQAMFQYQQLTAARAQAVESIQKGRESLSEKQKARSLDLQRSHAKQIEEGQAVLARDIKGWGPELAGKLASFAQSEFGLSPQELANVVDPRAIKILHRAYTNTQAEKTKQAADRIQKTEGVKPPPKVGGTTIPPKGLDDRLSTEEWVRRRNEQVRAANRR